MCVIGTFSPVGLFGGIPDAALLRTGGVSVCLMVLHKIESYFTDEVKHDIFYSRLRSWISNDGFDMQRGFFVGFCPAYCLGLVLLVLVMRGPPWPMLCVFAYVAQCSHEVHHLAKAVVRRGYYPGAVTAVAFVLHSHFLLAGARRCVGLGQEWQLAYLAIQLGLGVLFANQYRAFLRTTPLPAKCLILGASRGLGQALARNLKARQTKLVLVSRSPLSLIEVGDELASDCFPGTVCSDTFMKDLQKRCFGADLIITCAGTGISDLAGGLENTFALADAVLEPQGKLVVVGSIAGLVALPEPHAQFSARKHFTTTYVDGRRPSSKYHVTLVCPGMLRTDEHYAQAAELIVDGLHRNERTMTLGLGGRLAAMFGCWLRAEWVLPFMRCV